MGSTPTDGTRTSYVARLTSYVVMRVVGSSGEANSDVPYEDESKFVFPTVCRCFNLQGARNARMPTYQLQAPFMKGKVKGE